MYGAKLIVPLLLLLSVSYALQISEIMYNPSGSDTGREWVEIYNDGEALDLGNIKLRTDETDHSLGAVLLAPGGYAVIAQDNATFLLDYEFNGTCIDSSWTGLSNSVNKTIVLKNSTFVFDNITYEPLAAEGMSLCRNVSWYECSPTPGMENIIVEPPDFTSTNSTCNVSMKIEAPELYTSGYSIVVNDTSCGEKNMTIEYWIEDLFGTIVKDMFNTTQSVACEKSIARTWTPDVEGSEAYVIFSRIAASTCGDANASRMIVVKGVQPAAASSISITGADDEASFGESANIDLYVYRGDADKYAIDIYVEKDGVKVSSISKFHAGSRMEGYEVQIPVQIKPNCNAEYADGTYNIVAEGLDVQVTRQIKISGISSSNCKTVTVSSGGGGGSSSIVTSKTASKAIEMVSAPDTVYIGEEFEVLVSVKVPTASVYSYVYSGNTPVSEGFDGEWSGLWTANKKDITAEMNHTVALKSRIEDGTKPGIYTLRAKLSSGDEVTREIEVKGVIAADVSNSTNLTADDAENKIILKEIPKVPITGFAVKSRSLEDYKEILQIISLVLKHIYSEPTKKY